MLIFSDKHVGECKFLLFHRNESNMLNTKSQITTVVMSSDMPHTNHNYFALFPKVYLTYE